MRVAVHDYSGHPFQVQLSRELARRGHDVLHLHCSSYRTGKGAVARHDGDPDTFAVEAVALEEAFAKYAPWKRLRQERDYARRLLRRLGAFHPELVLSSNTPLFAQKLVLPGCRALGARFVFWQQDIYSVAMRQAAEARLPLLGRSLGHRFLELERRLLLASDAVVSISEDFRPILRRWGVPDRKLYVIENWAPLDELPVLPRDNAWARDHALADKQVILYSGTLGLKHDPALLLALAASFRDRPDVRVVVVSEGRGAEWLADRRNRDGLGNLVLLPFQPYDRLPEVHATADVLALVLERAAGIFSVPSKTLTYHCAGRPLLAGVPDENLAARLIRANDSGIVVDPDQPGAFVAAAERLLGDAQLRERLGENARRYAEETFDIQRVGDRFEDVVTTIAERPGGVAVDGSLRV